MIKKVIKYFLYFLFLIFIGILYLSYFGVETKRFNQFIKNEVSKVNEQASIELKDVKILLNLSNFSITLNTHEPNFLVKIFVFLPNHPTPALSATALSFIGPSSTKILVLKLFPKISDNLSTSKFT